MKKILIIFIGTILFLPAIAQQNEGINFVFPKPFEEILKVAKAENKNIFVDCFATWCGPCKLLSKQTFPLKEVGDFFNKRFVCVQYDIEKGNGIKFHSMYKSHIPGLPTMLVVNPEGTVIHAIVGFRSGKALIEDITNGLEGKNLANLEKQYKAGERSINFMKDYLKALKDAYKKKKIETVSKDYLSKLPVETLLDQDIWEMAKDYISNPYAPDYKFVVNNMYKIKYAMKESSLLFERQLDRGMDRAINHLLPSLERKDVSVETLDSLAVLKKLLYMNKLQNSASWLMKIEIANFMRDDKPMEVFRLVKCASLLHLFAWDRTYLRNTYQYLVNCIDDKEILKQCLDETLDMQQLENNSSLPVNFYGVIAQLYKKLGALQESETATKQFEKLENINNEKAKQFYEVFKK